MTDIHIVKKDLYSLASQIENLANAFQAQLSCGGDLLTTANELVRNSNTFVFALGEFFALKNKSGVKLKAVAPAKSNRDYSKNHSYRDALGRFARQ